MEAGAGTGARSKYRSLVAKADRELEVEECSRRKQSAHFILHYREIQRPLQPAGATPRHLDDGYRDLADQLGYEPSKDHRDSVHPKGIRRHHGAPSWAGAINDGKLRIPIGGVTAMHLQLERNPQA